MNEKSTTIRFPADLKKRLRMFSAEQGITMESIAAQAFLEYEERVKAGTKELKQSPAKESGEPPVPHSAAPAYDTIHRDLAAISTTLKEIASRLPERDLRERLAGPRAERESARKAIGGKSTGKSGVDISVDGKLAKGSGGTGGKND